MKFLLVFFLMFGMFFMCLVDWKLQQIVKELRAIHKDMNRKG